MANTKYCPLCRKEVSIISLKCEHCGSIFSSESDTGSFTGFDQQVQQALKDRYKLKGIVGKGGMAVVYKAIQLNLNRTVALKVVHENLVHDGEFLQRFTREAQVSASLNHRNIVTVYDVGVAGNIHYMAMEYLPGITLRDYIRKHNRLSPLEVRNFIAPIADALDYIHARRLVHRDMKSSNIIITSDNRSVLTDFGIVYVNDDNPLSQVGAVVGTPEYMSPEQAEGKVELDSRSDIFSLGTIMYEATTGRVPFHAQNPLSTIHQVIHENPSPPSSLNASLPAYLNNLIMDCLHKDKNRRMQKAAVISDSLSREKYVRINHEIADPKTARFTKEAIERSGAKNSSQKNKSIKDLKDKRNKNASTSTLKSTHGKRKNKTTLILLMAVAFIIILGYLFSVISLSDDHMDSLAVEYYTYVKQGDEFFNSKDFQTALEQYTLAYELNGTDQELIAKINITQSLIISERVQAHDPVIPSQSQPDISEIIAGRDNQAATTERNESEAQAPISQQTQAIQATPSTQQITPNQEIAPTQPTPSTQQIKLDTSIPTPSPSSGTINSRGSEPAISSGLTSSQLSTLNRFEMKLVTGYSGGAFYIASTEVTQNVYSDVMGTNPSVFSGNNRPVDNISYDDALQFLNRLNQRYGMNFRLPAPGEWEFAASGGRLGSKTNYSGSNSISDVAVYFDNSSGSTQPVKSRKPNELGLYDMSGNVWEWIQGSILKGGSWLSPSNLCTINSSDRKNSSYKDYCTGFRLAHDAN